MDVAVSGFQHQVGGHFGLLQCEGHVAKPLDARELAFYKQMDPLFTRFAPAYCGTVRVRASARKDGGLRLFCDKRSSPCHPDAPSPKNSRSEKIHSRQRLNGEMEKEEEERVWFRVNEEGRVEVDFTEAHHWAATCQIKVVQKLLSNGADGSNFILLENIVHGMERPCVLDLKMGTRQHGDDASVEKKKAQKAKCAESTSGELGVRMVGMELYEEATASYSFIDKMQGRKMNKSHFSECLNRFIWAAGKERAASLKLRLGELRSMLAESSSYRFFSSSLLVAFDAAKTDSPIQVRMIDFAHSTFSGFSGFNDVAYEGADDGYIKGIDSLLQRIPSGDSFWKQSVTPLSDVIRPPTPSYSSDEASLDGLPAQRR